MRDAFRLTRVCERFCGKFVEGIDSGYYKIATDIVSRARLTGRFGGLCFALRFREEIVECGSTDVQDIGGTGLIVSNLLENAWGAQRFALGRVLSKTTYRLSSRNWPTQTR